MIGLHEGATCHRTARRDPVNWMRYGRQQAATNTLREKTLAARTCLSYPLVMFTLRSHRRRKNSPQSCCHDDPTTLTGKERAIATPKKMRKHSSQNGTTNQRRPLTSKLSNTRVPHQTHRHWLKPSTIFSDVTRHKALHRFKLIIANTSPYVTLRASSRSSQRSPLGTSIATDSTQNSGTRDPCCNVWKVAFVNQR